MATDATGSFTVDLLPGRYSLTGRSPLYDDGNSDCQPATRATVRPDRVQRADVYRPLKMSDAAAMIGVWGCTKPETTPEAAN